MLFDLPLRVEMGDAADTFRAADGGVDEVPDPRRQRGVDDGDALGDLSLEPGGTGVLHAEDAVDTVEGGPQGRRIRHVAAEDPYAAGA
ncbi:hypothetical protein Acor_83200 [Acrocarpospora corrugata]|uniref:Uncharacterized protein n=1 Tax=Acrocarpospora corrugata TaxID=35763 RepID=A0A5M3WGM2_9ACTN|nr:hypothetical protein [Acrocarpospora corrugata]GES06251.1 hypothetical protein Acor_83200 [Acrocarpospora corrugata]